MDGTATSEDFVADLRLQRERRQRERASRQQLLQQGASTNGTMPAASAATSSTDSFPSARRWEGDVMCAEQIDFLSAVLWVLHSSGCLSVRAAWRGLMRPVCVQHQTSLPRSTNEHYSTAIGVMVTPLPALLVQSPAGS